MLLTDELLLDYKRCKRRAFLNCYGNYAEKDPESEFLLKLRSENEKNVTKFLARLDSQYYEIRDKRHNWQQKALETLALMKQGVNYIRGGVLAHSFIWEDGREVVLVGFPTLLVKQTGSSQLGNWFYYPLNIHLGKRPKPEYKTIAAFHAHLLKKIQATLPTSAQLILRRQNSHAVNLPYWIPRMEEILKECLRILADKVEPEVFISRQRCSLCHWYSHCYAIARSQQHLSLVPGVTPNRYEHLLSLGLETVESIATASPGNVGELIGREVASYLIQQARSILEKRAILKPNYQRKNYPPLPTAEIELYFDIEAEPDRELDYLLGIVLVDRSQDKVHFFPFLAENPEDEALIWSQFLSFVLSYQDAPIFHFSEYEVETIKRLGKLYQTPRAQINTIVSRCVDLHKRVVNSVTLPVESYSLKSIANWLEFSWRDLGVSGEQSVCWYDNWLKTGDRSFLEAILRYNEDDCRATLKLKNWLSEFLAQI